MQPLTFISLFAGIGGIDLGLERAGMRCAAQVEIDDYCTRVLAKHWPDVRRFRDVRSVGAHNLPRANVIAGGFPCQDISSAGRGAGITGARSGLWAEFARIIRELRPCYVLVENVAALLHRGIDTVLGDLAALGFDAEWHCIPAAALGAPHIRDRVYIVAHAERHRWQQGAEVLRAQQSFIASGREDVSDASIAGVGRLAARQQGQSTEAADAHWRSQNVPNADCNHKLGRRGHGEMGRLKLAQEISNYGHAARTQWTVEPDVGRVAHGVPARVDRLKGLGNAVVPQAAELVGRAIVEHHRVTI